MRIYLIQFKKVAMDEDGKLNLRLSLYRPWNTIKHAIINDENEAMSTLYYNASRQPAIWRIVYYDVKDDRYRVYSDAKFFDHCLNDSPIEENEYIEGEDD